MIARRSTPSRTNSSSSAASAGGLRRSTGSSFRRSRSSLSRSVSFGEEHTKMVEISTIDADARRDIWYSKKELEKLNQKEIRKNFFYQLQVDAAGEDQDSLESKGLTWRGLEGVTREDERQGKIAFYVRTVVYEHHNQTDASELKRLAKALSKEERVKAQQMGKQDQLQVHGDKKECNNNLAKRKAALGRSLSGSINWMKQSANFRSTKKESALAA